MKLCWHLWIKVNEATPPTVSHQPNHGTKGGTKEAAQREDNKAAEESNEGTKEAAQREDNKEAAESGGDEGDEGLQNNNEGGQESDSDG